MSKIGLLFNLAGIAIKLIEGFGLLRMSKERKNANNGPQYEMDYAGGDDYGQNFEKKGRIFPQPNLNTADKKQLRAEEESSEQN